MSSCIFQGLDSLASFDSEFTSETEYF